MSGPVWMGMTAGTPGTSGPVAHTMFYGMIGLSGSQILLILLTWFSFYPSPGIDEPTESRTKSEEGEEREYSPLDDAKESV